MKWPQITKYSSANILSIDWLFNHYVIYLGTPTVPPPDKPQTGISFSHYIFKIVAVLVAVIIIFIINVMFF